MKKVIRIFVLSLSIGLLSFTAVPVNIKNSKFESTPAKITWKSEVIYLGNIPLNSPKSMDFEFKNTGLTDVVITNVQGSCGCTATNYTKTKIAAGQVGTVTATFNAANKGAFSKTVTVTTSASATPTVLVFEGTVI